uniref:Uncharacterized protein n=2 Tax=Eptatretus burgeri TaxID=7764 RepID=A0A8C4WZL9_EPTBU
MALSRTQMENTAKDEEDEDEEDEEVDVDVEGDFDGNGFHDVIGNLTQPLVNRPGEEYLNTNWAVHVHDEVWALDASIDAESRKTIEQMLKEERQYLFRKGNFGKHSQLLKQDPAGAGSSSRRKVQKEKIKSDGTLKTRRVPWTQAEKAAFEEGLAQFGHSWTKISNLIPSRSLLQVRVFARRYLRTRGLLGRMPKLGGHVSTFIMASEDHTNALKKTSTMSVGTESLKYSMTGVGEMVRVSGCSDGSGSEVDIDGMDDDVKAIGLRKETMAKHKQGGSSGHSSQVINIGDLVSDAALTDTLPLRGGDPQRTYALQGINQSFALDIPFTSNPLFIGTCYNNDGDKVRDKMKMENEASQRIVDENKIKQRLVQEDNMKPSLEEDKAVRLSLGEQSELWLRFRQEDGVMLSLGENNEVKENVEEGIEMRPRQGQNEEVRPSLRAEYKMRLNPTRGGGLRLCPGEAGGLRPCSGEDGGLKPCLGEACGLRPCPGEAGGLRPCPGEAGGLRPCPGELTRSAYAGHKL